MRTAILYATRASSTARCVDLLAEHLSAPTERIRLQGVGSMPFPVADAVVIGGPVYGGLVLPAVRRFCERWRERLLERPVAVFACCLQTGEAAAEHLHASYPPWLLAHAFGRFVLGGAVNLSALGPLARRRVRRLGVTSDIERFDRDAIRELAHAVNGLEGRPAEGRPAEG